MTNETELPAEVTIDRAAEILNVDRGTVMKYLRAGLIEWRDAAPPGSLRRHLRLKLSSVVAIRTDYRSEPIDPIAPPRERKPRSRAAVTQPYQPKNFKLYR